MSSAFPVENFRGRFALKMSLPANNKVIFLFSDNVGTPIIEDLTLQGDGRKFLDRFKSYFGSQISPQSLNEIHIYRLQTKSATKDVFIYFCL